MDNDLFADKAQDWDQAPVPVQISQGVGAAMLQALELDGRMRVMDFGAGTGLVASQIAPRVARVHAVDISQAMLERLAAKPELRDKVEVHCQDILEQPLEERVELVVSAMALHHVEDTEALLAALYAHLEPGGRVALADLDEEEGDFHPAGMEGVYHHGFERSALQARLEAAGFEQVRFVTACEVDKGDKRYPIFLVTAQRA